MKVLLTGGSGFLGSHIARELTAAGHSARLLLREGSKRDGLVGLTYETALGDILDRASLDRAMDGVDAVIHTAGLVSFRRKAKADLFRVNVDGTRNVLAAAQARGIRVVHTSSIAAIGATESPSVLNEESPWTIGDYGIHYINSKRRGEEVVREFAEQGVNAVIVNPGTILGPGDVYLTSSRFVLEYLRGRNTFYPGGGTSFCDVREVARAHVTALTKGRTGERYILAGQNVTYREALQTFHALSGAQRPRRLPKALGFVAAFFCEAAALVARHPLEDVTFPFIRFSFLYQAYDVSKAARELDYVVRPFEETVRDTILDHLKRGLAKPTTPTLRAYLEPQPN
ncbi:MAG: NAD-dependent epimerase/dehydratase family protein [Deltaproteobacteria bacterium]|nr:NAD-dependent epimerase/dehydratase family protein [Deltaproteobacteria bacterium]